MKTPSLSTVTRVVMLAALYYLAGWLGRESSFLNHSVYLVWPPSGIALGALLLFGYRYVPGVFLGALLTTTLLSTSVSFAIGAALGSGVGAMVCVYLLQRFVAFRNSLERIRDVAGLLILGTVMGTTVNAAFNAISLTFSSQMDWSEFTSNWLLWWVPNAMANLVITPFIVTWGSGTFKRPGWRLLAEAAICGGGLVAATLISFNSWYVQGVESYPLAYLPFPFLVLIAMRFGQRGTTAGVLLVASLALAAVLDGRGPFVMENERDSLLLVGSYITVMAVTNMLLAASVAERENAEADVRRSQERYRGVVEDQTEMISRMLPDGTLTFVNETFCRFHGRARGELFGRRFTPNVLPEDRDTYSNAFAAITPANPVMTFDCRVKPADGMVCWHRITLRGIYDEQGLLAEYQMVTHDITRRKDAEEALRANEQRTRTILNCISEGILTINEQGQIDSFNPAAERIFGHRFRDLVGQPFLQLLDEGAREPYRQYVLSRAQQSEPACTELQARRRDGTLFPLELDLSEMPWGKGRFFIAVVRDVSERKKLEAQVQQSQKLEAVGRLAAGIAHDFNNVMQAIIGYGNLALRKTAADDPNRECLEQIERAAERAAILTSKLLSFSRKQVIQPRVIQLNSVLQDMMRLLRRVTTEEVELVTRLAPDLAEVKLDPGEFEQILLNLAINACDAMPQGGKLTLETANCRLDEADAARLPNVIPGPYVQFTVTDSGTGMSAEVKAHLFEPFFTTKQDKGTGLGLSMIYGIVRQNGGHIAVESTEGQGTTFRLYLPALAGAASAAPTPAPAPAPPPEGGRETLLVVEDEELVRFMLVEVLQNAGYRVLSATNGRDALDICRTCQEHIHLLVSDLMMPEMSGRQLAEKLLALRPALKVLYISGYTSDDVVRLEILHTQASFLQKPFRPEALLLKVREMIHAPATKA